MMPTFYGVASSSTFGPAASGIRNGSSIQPQYADAEVMTTTLPEILPSIGYAASPRFHPAIWPLTAHSDDDGRLCIGEIPLRDIADEFRTPTYVIDETDFRTRARRYRTALRNT
jgi:hypothetical protein